MLVADKEEIFIHLVLLIAKVPAVEAEAVLSVLL